MENNLEQKIIQLYLDGIGSTTISKMLSINKKKILTLLKEKKLIRVRHLPKEFYDNFWEINGVWYGHWVCENCNEKILFSVNEKSLLNRNLKNKKICKKCSLLKQFGEGNPFFGKKHSDKTINKISQSRIGIRTSDHMSKPEYRELVSRLAKERWSNGSMEEVRIKMSNLMKKRISNGELKGYNRSKAEDEIIEILKKMDLESIPNFILEGKIFDIFIPKFNLLIEYNGDYWHCNPKKYDPNYFNTKKSKTAKEIWEYDKNKIDLAVKHNYNYEVIWESDYKSNKDILYKTIKKYDNN